MERAYPLSPAWHNTPQLPEHPHNILNPGPNTATLPPRGTSHSLTVNPLKLNARPRTAPHTYPIDTARDGLQGNSEIGGAFITSDQALGGVLARERRLAGRNRSSDVISPRRDFTYEYRNFRELDFKGKEAYSTVPDGLNRSEDIISPERDFTRADQDLSRLDFAGKAAYIIAPDRSKYLTYTPPSRFVFDASEPHVNQQNAPNVVLNQPEPRILPSSLHIENEDQRNSNDLIGTCLQESSDDCEEQVNPSQDENLSRLSQNSENFDLALYKAYEDERFRRITSPNLLEETTTFLVGVVESQPYPNTLDTPSAYVTGNLPLEPSLDITYVGFSGCDQPVKGNIHKPTKQSQNSSPTQPANGTSRQGFGGDVDDDFSQYSPPTHVVSGVNHRDFEDDSYERLNVVDQSSGNSSWLAENAPFQSNYDLPVPDRITHLLTEAYGLGVDCLCPCTAALLIVGFTYALWDLGYVN